MSIVNQWLELFRQFRANWRQFLVVHVAVNVVVFVILAPLATVLLNFSVALSGEAAIITDEPALAVSVLEQRMELNPAERLLMHLADVFDRPSLYREQ